MRELNDLKFLSKNTNTSRNCSLTELSEVEFVGWEHLACPCGERASMIGGPPAPPPPTPSGTTVAAPPPTPETCSTTVESGPPAAPPARGRFPPLCGFPPISSGVPSGLGGPSPLGTTTEESGLGGALLRPGGKRLAGVKSFKDARALVEGVMGGGAVMGGGQTALEGPCPPGGAFVLEEVRDPEVVRSGWEGCCAPAGWDEVLAVAPGGGQHRRSGLSAEMTR